MYDALGRITSASSVCSGSDTELVTYAYDSSTAGRFAIGRLSTMGDPSGSTDYFYERRGLTRREDRIIESDSYSTAYAYDAAGNRSKLGESEYTYDHAGRPITVARRACPACSALTIIASASYLPFGPETELVFGNGMKQSKSYDVRYRMTENKLTSAGLATLARYSYGSDAAGNITAIHDLVTPGYDRTFAYDDLNRLTTANTGSSLWGPGTFAYDALGNPTSLSLGNARNASFTYSGTTPKLASVTENGTIIPLTYDANGNEKSSYSSSYSCRNLLTAPHENGTQCTVPPCPGPPSNITIPSDILTYDGRGVRVASERIPDDPDAIVVQRQYLYTPELQLLTRIDLTAGNTDSFTWFAGHPVAQWSSSTNAIRYTVTDHLGTPILQTDVTAIPTIVWRAEYEPYGNPYLYRAGSADEQPLRFPGQEFVTLTTTGTEEMYNIFRWYRSRWGRYTQADPMGIGGAGHFDGKSMQQWSLRRLEVTRRNGLSGAGMLTGYAYADDAPIKAADPLGLFVQWSCIARRLNTIATSFPNDPKDASKGFSPVCTYEVNCDAVDMQLGNLKIKAYWWRKMPSKGCPCDKTCFFDVRGVPQSINGVEFFVPTAPVRCFDTDFDPRHFI